MAIISSIKPNMTNPVTPPTNPQSGMAGNGPNGPNVANLGTSPLTQQQNQVQAATDQTIGMAQAASQKQLQGETVAPQPTDTNEIEGVQKKAKPKKQTGQNILYGVVGEGMGHATRSRVILEHLLKLGHRVKVVVSGRAHGFLTEKFRDHPNITVQEIHGLTLSYEDNVLDKSDSLWTNLKKAPKGLVKNIREYARVSEQDFRPELVISDFESLAYLYGIDHRIPVISIDNMQIINRCEHDDQIRKQTDFKLAKVAVKVKIAGAYHYLVSSFFYPRVRKKRTTLVPPILRPVVLDAKREPGNHILVYQTASTNTQLIPELKRLPHEFRVYGMGQEGSEGNVTLCGFSETGFIDDLRTARAVIAGGGFSLMSEAVFLKVPFLSVPIQGQFEQELNARYLELLGYGAWSDHLSLEVMEGFIGNIDQHAQALQSYKSMDNEMILACLEELLDKISQGEPRPVTLESPSLGSYVAKA